MSLLDDVSIVITPNGYKAGELYAVVPEPSEGSEEVTDGNFPSPNTSWSLSGWEILGNLAKNSVDGAGNNLYQGSVTSVNQLFKVVITTTITAGSVKVMLGGGTGGYNEIGEATSTGTFTYYGTSFGTDNRILLQTGTGSVIGSVQLSNISVKEYTSADMDVTRATAGTRVDENGLVNYAEILGGELVTNGDFATDTDWSKASGWSISGGTANANTTAYRTLAQNIPIILGKKYKVVYDVVSYTSGSVSMTIGANSGILRNAVGTYTEIIEYNNFYSSSGVRSGGVGFVGSIDNVSVKEVTRDNVPRIDYTGGGCPHILSEPQRTNLVTYSSDFSQWNNNQLTIEPNAIISPDGTLNASKITPTTTSSVHLISTSGSTTMAMSIYAKSNGYHRFRFNSGSSGNGYASFDLNAGTVISSGGTYYTSSSIDSVGNGWYRCTLVLTSGVASVTTLAIEDDSGNVSFTGDGTSAIYIWGGQSEVGSYPTSYIPTSGSTVTRNQDIFTRDGIGSLINDSEGVLFVEMAALSDDLTDRRISLNDGSNANEIIIGYSRFTGNIIGEVFSGGSIQNSNWAANGVTQTNNNKFALSWGGGTMKFYLNGLQTNIETGITSPVGLNNLEFSLGNDTLNMFGKVKQLQVYTTALTDTQLAALTS